MPSLLGDGVGVIPPPQTRMPPQLIDRRVAGNSFAQPAFRIRGFWLFCDHLRLRRAPFGLPAGGAWQCRSIVAIAECRTKSRGGADTNATRSRRVRRPPPYAKIDR